jgi:hypothetical protein
MIEFQFTSRNTLLIVHSKKLNKNETDFNALYDRIIADLLVYKRDNLYRKLFHAIAEREFAAEIAQYFNAATRELKCEITSVESYHITNLTGIEKFPNLNTLKIYRDAAKFVEITLNIDKMINITWLHIGSYAFVKDFSNLKYFHKLTNLSLESSDYNNSENLDVLASLKNITDLTINNYNCNTLYLENMKKLKNLNIKGCNVHNIELPENNKITSIAISKELNINNLDFLLQCKKLKNLGFQFVSIRNFEVTKFLNTLEELRISYNEFPVDINQLSKRVKKLQLNNNNANIIYDLKNKKQCEIVLKENKTISDSIINIEVLSEFNNLKLLDMFENGTRYNDNKCNCDICKNLVLKEMKIDNDKHMVFNNVDRTFPTLSFLHDKKDLTLNINNIYVRDFSIIFNKHIKFHHSYNIRYNPHIVAFKYFKILYFNQELTNAVINNSTPTNLENRDFKDICLRYNIDYETGECNDVEFIQSFYKTVVEQTSIKTIKLSSYMVLRYTNNIFC